MSRARWTLPDKPSLALPIGRRSPATDRTRRPRRATSRASGNGRARRQRPQKTRPVGQSATRIRSIRHARRHRRDQLRRKQQSGAAIGPKGNSRRPAAGTTLLDHRKIPPIRGLSLGNRRRGDDVQVLGIRRRNSPSLDWASGRLARPFAPDLSKGARDLGWQGAIAIDSVDGFWRVDARARLHRAPTYCVSRDSSKSHRAKYSCPAKLPTKPGLNTEVWRGGLTV
jgi:hypothetical protein